MSSKNSTLNVRCTASNAVGTFDVPDNQQETRVPHFFYYTGFCVGELTCSLIRASNKGKGFYFTPDITISNQDISLLQEVNRIVASNSGIISPIKGGYNLKFRGKKRVEDLFQFFLKYPVVTGDIAKTKLELLRKILPAIGKYSKVQTKDQVIEECRNKLKDLKLNGLVEEMLDVNHFNNDEVGFFVSGIMDAEGSCGLKKSGLRMQPFFAVAMKDRKIIELVKEFLACGNIHKRSDDGLYHWETNKKSDVIKVIKIFTAQYPSKLQKMKDRMGKVERILNDYMPSSGSSSGLRKKI